MAVVVSVFENYVATYSNVSGIVETRDATMERNPKLPLSADSKTLLLRKLQGTIHFEKMLTAISSAKGNKYKLTLPAWFVRNYGDKFRKSAFLRTESSTKSWPVNLSISFPSSNRTQVVFSRGWKAFATFHGLREGDSLVFSLTAISEFEVYIFSSTRNPKRSPSQAQKMWSNRSELNSRKKAKQLCECRVNEQLGASRSIGAGTVKLNGLIPKKRAVGEERAVSASSHSSTSCSLASSSNDLQLLESENVLDSSSRGLHDWEKSALNEDYFMVSGPGQQTSARKNGEDNEYQNSGSLPRTFRCIPNLPVFFKTMAVINIYDPHRMGGKTACMEIPLDYCKAYGSRLHSLVKLQGIQEESQERTVACHPSRNAGRQARLYLRAGWRDFTAENNLKVGQVLVFTLTADSFFVVRGVVPSSRENIAGHGRV